MNLPTGIVTFLFTDIEGSTRLWEEHPEAMRLALAQHDRLLDETIRAEGGVVFKTIGDAFCAAFSAAPAALRAALEIQRALAQAETVARQENAADRSSALAPPFGPATLALRVRMALHTGMADERNGDYFGPTLNRVARLMSVGHGGQVLISESTRALLRDTLPDHVTLVDRGVHRLKDLQQPEAIWELRHPDLLTDFPPLRSLDPVRTNLPVQLTSFIGRHQEMDEVRQHLREARLLTLTGAGGCGKTRLALQIGAEMAEEYPDGVWLVELAPLEDPTLVVQAIAMALNIRETPGRPLMQTLTEALRDRRLLLLLDNCEHLGDACARLTDALLRHCPELRILATSRASLGIDGETIYQVPLLSLPDPEQPTTPEALCRFDAVRLFVERAAAAAKSFAVTPGNTRVLAQVCCRLDGIPLAIELAAARVRSLAIDEINTRLDNRFRLLTGGSRAALPRQQTLRALIDWSYNLLSEPEKRLLARLSVFSGGWTLNAAEAVCATDDELEPDDMLDLLTSLLDKSLVVFDEQEERPRYRLLQTVRQYADERLAEFGEQDRMCKRHRDWCLAFAAQAEHCWSGPDLTIWLPRMAAEHDNLRAALSWRDPAETDNEAALRLARLMYRFWDIRGHFQEARERMTALLAEAAPRNTPDRAMLLANLASIAWRQSDYPAARACAEEALERYRELGDRPGEAAAVSILANILYYQGDHAAAIPLYELALDLSREAGEPGRIGMALNNFGMVFLDRQEWSRARPLFEESLQIRRRIGDRRGTAVLLGNLGHCKWQEGDLVNGRRLIDESLALFREIQDPIGIASALQSRGDFAIELEDDVLSRTSFVECLEIRRRRGDKWGISVVLISFVRLALRQGDPERAARCFGASLRLREQIGSAISAVERGAMDDLEARLREALGAEHFEAAYREGDGWNLDEAVDYVLQNSL